MLSLRFTLVSNFEFKHYDTEEGSYRTEHEMVAVCVTWYRDP